MDRLALSPTSRDVINPAPIIINGLQIREIAGEFINSSDSKQIERWIRVEIPKWIFSQKSIPAVLIPFEVTNKGTKYTKGTISVKGENFIAIPKINDEISYEQLFDQIISVTRDVSRLRHLMKNQGYGFLTITPEILKEIHGGREIRHITVDQKMKERIGSTIKYIRWSKIPNLEMLSFHDVEVEYALSALPPEDRTWMKAHYDCSVDEDKALEAINCRIAESVIENITGRREFLKQSIDKMVSRL